MKQMVLFILSLIATLNVPAQEVISTQGDSYSNTTGSFDFTLGEVIISTISDGSNILTQGFHQSKWEIVSSIDYNSSFEVSIFPNPLEDILNIQATAFKHVTYFLFDSFGKHVREGELTNEQTTIQLSQLAAGHYFLTLVSNKQKLKTFELIKTN